MAPIARPPTVPDEVVERYSGLVLSQDVGPLIGQAALLEAEGDRDPDVGDLIDQAVRTALADAAPERPMPDSRRASSSDVGRQALSAHGRSRRFNPENR